MKTEEEIIKLAREHIPGLELVHVDEPDAEKLFLDSKVLFDVSSGGKKLEKFFSKRPHLDKLRAETERGFSHQTIPFGSGDDAHIAYITVHEDYGKDRLRDLLLQFKKRT